MKRLLLFLLIFFLLTSVTWGDPGIDIGAPAIDRTNTFTDNTTVIEESNPANASGIITSVQIYTRFGADALRIGTFSKDGDVFTCRHSVAVGDAIDGWNEFSELSIEVEAGDYIGFYFYGEGGIERSLSGGVGIWYKSGEYITLKIKRPIPFWLAISPVSTAQGQRAGHHQRPIGDEE